MKVSQFLLFLAALTGAASNLVFKKHVHVNTPMTWFDARKYCRENYVDLSIIDTLEEFIKFRSQTAAIAGVESFIGLGKNLSDSSYNKWCDGTNVSFANWGLVNAIHSENCITTINNVWNDNYCVLPLPFFCYTEVILVKEMKTWDEASQHCRTHYTDLFSVITPIDLLVVTNIRLNITTSSFWTGLHFLDGSWFWVKKNPLGSLVSLPSCPDQPFFCGAQNAVANIWENRDCWEKMYFTCIR